MAGIVKYVTVRDTLLDCEAFESDHQLAALFADGRIHPWRHLVPNAGSPAERVEATIKALYDQFNQAGQNALELLVELLRDIKDPQDRCHQDLADLAEELAVGGVELPLYEPLRNNYLQRLKAEASKLSALIHIDPTSPERQLKLTQIYTALLTLGGDERETVKQAEKPKPISALEQLNRNHRLVLIGAPGSGKSTFVDFVAMCMAGELLDDEQMNLMLLQTPLPKEEGHEAEPQPQTWQHGALLPLKIELRRFVAEGLPKTGEATSEQVWLYLSQQLPSDLREYVPRLKAQFRDKGGIVLFDGLDEIPDPDQSGPRLKAVLEDMGWCYPKCRLVVTSRPYAYQNPKWQLHGFKQTTLAHFSAGQIRQFIHGWYGYLGDVYKWPENTLQARANQLEQAIFSRHHELRPLAEKPLLLTLMVNLHANTGNLPNKRAELYEETVKLLLDRWERGRLSAKEESVTTPPSGAKESVIPPHLSDYLEINQTKIRELLQTLAFEAHANQQFEKVADTANLNGDKLLSGLMRLAAKEVNPTELLEYLNQRAGILENVDSQGEGLYRFPHRTFQEYLAACALNGKPKSSREIAKLVKAEPNRWREVALLAAAKRDVESFWTLINALCAKAVVGLPHMEAGDFMAALIAGQAINESGQASRLMENEADNEVEIELVSRVRGWLERLTSSELPILERVAAGEVLARLGDERGGVGLLDE